MTLSGVFAFFPRPSKGENSVRSSFFLLVSAEKKSRNSAAKAVKSKQEVMRVLYPIVFDLLVFPVLKQRYVLREKEGFVCICARFFPHFYEGNETYALDLSIFCPQLLMLRKGKQPEKLRFPLIFSSRKKIP